MNAYIYLVIILAATGYLLRRERRKSAALQAKLRTTYRQHGKALHELRARWMLGRQVHADAKRRLEKLLWN